MVFVHDTLPNGRTARVLTVLEVYSRECVALEAGVGFRAADVARILTDVGVQPGSFPLDPGRQRDGVREILITGRTGTKVRLDFSRLGKPTDNPFIEAFNGSLRRECLAQHWFIDVADASRTLQRWREEYNNIRPHSSLKAHTPASFGRGGHFIPGPNRFGFSTTCVSGSGFGADGHGVIRYTGHPNSTYWS